MTRPKDMATSLAAALSARGHRVRMEPLLKIDPVFQDEAIPEDIQAVLITSPRGAKFGASRQLLPYPAFSIGKATAQAAKKYGWKSVIDAQGDGQALADKVKDALDPRNGSLLHLRGETARDTAPHLLQDHGFVVHSRVVYQARPVANFTTATMNSLDRGQTDGVLLFSPATAATYCEIVEDLELIDSCRDMDVFCLSSAVSEPVAALPWKRSFIATQPNTRAMLELIDDVAREA